MRNQVLNIKAIQSPHPIVGNGQHIGVAALVLAAAMLSIEFFEIPPVSKAIETPEPTRKQARCDENIYIYISIFLSIYLSIYLYIYLSICLSIYIYIVCVDVV